MHGRVFVGSHFHFLLKIISYKERGVNEPKDKKNAHFLRYRSRTCRGHTKKSEKKERKKTMEEVCTSTKTDERNDRPTCQPALRGRT